MKRTLLVAFLAAATAMLPGTEPSDAQAGPGADQVVFRGRFNWGSTAQWSVNPSVWPDLGFRFSVMEEFLADEGRRSHGWFLGDWDGDGFDTPGVMWIQDGEVWMSVVNSLPPDGGEILQPDIERFLELTMFEPDPMTVQAPSYFFGDWNGDGVDSLGIYDFGSGEPNVLLFDESGTQTHGFWFGLGRGQGLFTRDTVLPGDWNGDGVDTIGVFRRPEAKVFYSNSNPTVPGAVAPTDSEFWFGHRLDRPIVGDWDNDGVDGIGVVRTNPGDRSTPTSKTTYIRNSLTTGIAESHFTAIEPQLPADGPGYYLGGWAGRFEIP